jgi:fatty-acyl-CoA synthase
MVEFKTVAEAVAKIGSLYPHNGFTFQDLDGKEVTYTFPTLAKDTERRGAALQRLGLKKGDRLGMIVIDPEQFVLTFLAAVRIGVVPVPIYPPLYLGRLDSYFQQTESVLNTSSTSVLVVSSRLVNVLSRLTGNVRTLERLVEVEQLTHGCDEEPLQEWEVSPDDPVFLQYTSGTTTHPRGVIVTHRNLISNVRAFVTSGLQVDPKRDKGITWLPLFHDMGLVGFVLGPVCCGVSVVFIPTIRFIKNPAVWMETIDIHRGTISFAPNFAFNLAVRRADAGRWDLSCVKALGCGGEPIHPETIREFMGLFQRCGLAPDAILPAYGLAESTLAVTMKRLHEPVRFRRIDRAVFEKKGVAEELNETTTMALEHVSCGVPFPGHDLAILDRSGRPVPECTEGEICLRGPSIAAGYIGESEEFHSAMRNGWFHTADLGYLAQGELYVTGRIKDLIILNGRNIHPQTIEWLACTVAGVKKGSVAAFSRPGQLGEELVLAVEARSSDTARITSAIEVALQQAILTKPADIVCIKPGSLPRTSSGKLKRSQVRQEYLREGFRS